MNIFILDEDPVKAARQLNDKHLIKQILESAQLLSTAVLNYDCKVEGLYKSTHINHPCSIWVRLSSKNFEWLCNHALEMCEIYKSKSGKEHKSKKIIDKCFEWWKNNNSNFFHEKELTELPKCMPDECKITDPVQSYRRYYTMKKEHINKWTYNNTPEWYPKLKEEIYGINCQ